MRKTIRGATDKVGLVAVDPVKARKLIYKKVGDAVTGVTAAPAVSAEHALLRVPINRIDATMQLALGTSVLDRRPFFRFLVGLHRIAPRQFDRAKAASEAFQRHSRLKLQQQHYGILMGFACDSGYWQTAMALFAQGTHRPAYGLVPEVPVHDGKPLPMKRRDPEQLFVAPQAMVPNNRLYGKLMVACRLGGRWRHAALAFASMAREGTIPNNKVMSSLLTTLSESPRWDLTLRAFNAASTIRNSAGGNAAAPSTHARAHHADADFVAEFQPDYVLLRVVLNHIQAHRRAIPSAWAATLRILSTVARESATLFPHAAKRKHQEYLGTATNGSAAVEDSPSHAPSALGDRTDPDLERVGEMSPGASDLSPTATISTLDAGQDDDSVASTLVGANGLDAGMTNIALRALAKAGRWEHGVAVYNAFSAHGRLSDSVCTQHVFEGLTELNTGNPELQIAIVQHCFDSGFTVTAPMFTRLFGALYRCSRSDEALAAFYKLYDSSLDNVGNTQLSLTQMYRGMLASLLHHPVPAEALVLAHELQGTLDSTCVESTSHMSHWGDDSQLWTAEGRIAVVDETVLHAQGLEGLASHFDNVVVPYGCLVRFIDGIEDVPVAERRKHATYLQYVKRLCVPRSGLTATSPYRVLPFIHQLLALELFASVAEARQAHAAGMADADLLAAMKQETAERPTGDALTIVRDTNLAIGDDGRPVWRPAVDDDAPLTVVPAASSTAKTYSNTVYRNAFRVALDRSHVLSAAVMLRKHNPDAQVFVVTDNSGTHSAAEVVSAALAETSGAAGPPLRSVRLADVGYRHAKASRRQGSN
jgi:hypothetical protein